METRTLRIWDGENDDGGRLKVSGVPRVEYNGPYLERYETPTEAMKTNAPEKKGWRIGLILDAVKDRAAVFRQVVTSRDDPRVTDIVIGLGGDSKGPAPLAAWSTDPQHTDPPGQDAPCQVWDFTEREPTEEEKRSLAMISQGPPTDADRQRRREEEKAKQR